MRKRLNERIGRSHLAAMSALAVCFLLPLAGNGQGGPAGARAAAILDGSAFTGGAAALYGSVHYGEGPVNYVYAQPNGPRASMEAPFVITESSTGVPMFLYLRGRDDDVPSTCRIAVEINTTRIFEGPSGFPSDSWAVRSIPIPSGALKPGANTLTIRNIETNGDIGVPPWFMVSRAAVAPAGYTLGHDLLRDFRFTLPADERPFPEPLEPGMKPGFAVRGIKGWLWKPEQYLAEIPWLVRCRMNFLMNCYGSMCDIERHPWGDPDVNRWWEPLPEPKKRAYEKVVRLYQRSGIQFCFSMNPNICTRRIVRYGSAEDLNLLWRHYSWMQGLGVRWFNLSLDDIAEGKDAAGQARFVNALYRRLKERDPGARMIFCPTYYWGDGSGSEAKPYLETLARELDPSIYLFWTGDAVVGPITRKGAEAFRRISGHRLFLWDNYPVNDAQPTLHLGPVVQRDADLCAAVDGYMANSMHSQNEINRIPIFTCADYAYNPPAYDPERSIGQAILHQTEDRKGRAVLHDLVESYPGSLIFGVAQVGHNAVRDRFGRIVALPHGRPAAQAYVESLRSLLKRMDGAFPRRYAATKATIRNDIAWMEQRLDVLNP